ncbi:hypothetical protein [Streptomyces sp. CC210A]|uniref:hypothetical protein n=1 Tax=Streptomyces sp. CC210A TaxID=2898184 RepID=UPI001F33AA37|nr:hypothetical protein [Streptomyces sp. CC210A]
MTPHRKIRTSPAEKEGLSRPVQGGLYAAAVVLLPLLALGGSDGFREFLDFGTGVLALVSLTASVAWAIVATDRLLLTPRQRLLAQGIHRGTAVASLGFLLLHGTVKVSLGHVELLGALIPFGLGVTGTAGLIGFGSLAGLLMVVVAATGALRSTLAGRGAIAARWRPLHMLAYPAWCAALIHGLYAGRPAAGWVTALYCLALLGVAAAVAVRFLPAPLQERLADRVLTFVGPAPEGAQAPVRARGRGRGRRDPATAPLPGATSLGAAFQAEAPRPHPYEPEPGRRGAAGAFQGDTSQFASGAGRYAAAGSPDYGAGGDAYRPGGEPPLRGERGPGGGIAAGYRAVSLGGGSGTPAAGPPNGSVPYRAGEDGAGGSGPSGVRPGVEDVTQRIPFAERVPMTEELPLVEEEPTVRPGFWPTPSPPAPSPAPRAYAPPPPADPPGPFFPGDEHMRAPGTYQFSEPAAGEPWTAPAGERP